MRIMTLLLMLVLGSPAIAAEHEADVSGDISMQGVSDIQTEGTTIDELFSLYQPFGVNFAAYEPVYFLVGTNPEESKFQISFKYQFFREDNYIAVNHPWVKGFNVGYTQTSFWDLKTASAPFKDTSYKPEVFYLSSNMNIRPDWMKVFIINTGFRHESNGQGEDMSRSTNSFYLRPIFAFYRENGRFGLIVTPRVRFYIKNSDVSNPDLPDYRGCFDLDVKFGKAGNFVIGANLAFAKKGASFQTDLTYPLNNYIFRDLNLFLHVQYVDALAESLIDYRKRNRALRIGFALIR
ncbi:MAG: phospholipase A [Deltaproteobacteria bacterium]|nr:phospholipase A [Deltaproteobacteria bacterium]